jgi:hypothetical protein
MFFAWFTGSGLCRTPSSRLDSGSTADPIVPSDQAWKLIPGEVSADGADDRKRRDVGDGKAGPTHELAVDQEALSSVLTMPSYPILPAKIARSCSILESAGKSAIALIVFLWRSRSIPAVP